MPAPHPKLTPEVVQEAIKERLAGTKCRVIARRLGVNEGTLCGRMRAAGMPRIKADHRGLSKAEISRRANLNRNFGLTHAQYDEMLASQGGVCAICRQPERPIKGHPRRLAVDHDHATGKVRGLLCTRCNRVLGVVNDNASVLSRAADYLHGKLDVQTNGEVTP